MKILLTGFNAFKSVRVNPSEQVVRALADPGRRNAKAPIAAQLIAEVLPTEYAAASRKLRRLIRAVRPDAVLCLGVAAKRDGISLERVALNLDDEATPDNAGVVRRGRKIVRGGPDVYWSTLPLDALHKALRRRRIAVNVSNHAGTFLCNHAFYVARHEAARLRRRIPCGLIHLPRRARGGSPKRHLRIARLIRAVDCCLAVLTRSASKPPVRAAQ